MEIFDTKFTPGVRSGAVRFYAQRIGGRKDQPSAAVYDMTHDEDVREFGKADTFLDIGCLVILGGYLYNGGTDFTFHGIYLLI